MAAVRSRDTKAELAVRKALHRMGYRFRLHRRDLPAKPDVVLPRFRKVIFVHGCFWHKHDCRAGRSTPATRVDFWQAKRAANVERDKRAIDALTAQGWQVLVIWECWTRDAVSLARRLSEYLTR